MTKLSEPQRQLLWKLSVGPIHCVEYYPPAKKLINLGLARFSRTMLELTEAGRQLLQKLESK